MTNDLDRVIALEAAGLLLALSAGEPEERRRARMGSVVQALCDVAEGEREAPWQQRWAPAVGSATESKCGAMAMSGEVCGAPVDVLIRVSNRRYTEMPGRRASACRNHMFRKLTEFWDWMDDDMFISLEKL